MPDADGLATLWTPTSTSEMHAMCESGRKHSHAIYGQLSDIAAELKAVLPDVIKARGGGQIGFFGVDARMKAGRVVKPLMDAAALENEVARLFVLSYQRYVDLVVNANKKPKSSKFDVEG